MRRILPGLLLAVSCQPLDIVRIDPSISTVQPSSAVIGSVVTISGTNFSTTTDLNKVTFGSSQAIVLESSTRTLKVRVPDGLTGAVDLKVKVQGAPVSKPFTVQPSFKEELSVLPALNLGVNFNSGFSVGTDIYYGGGSTYQGSFTAYSKKLGKFSTVTGSWSQAADLPSARTGFIGFSVGNKGYILGGTYGAPVAGADPASLVDLWSFNPATTTWTPLSSYPGSQISGCAVLVIGTDVYFVAGVQDEGIVKTVSKYATLTNTWSKLDDFPGNRRINCYAFVIDGKGYVGGGIDFNNNVSFNDLYEFDPQKSNPWTLKASTAAFSTYGSYAFSLNGRGYVALGASGTSNDFPADVMEYDPQANVWTKITEFGEDGRRYGNSFSMGDKGYFIGGLLASNEGWTNEVWEFTAPSH